MVEITRTETVGEDGVLRLEVSGLVPGRKMTVAILDIEEAPHPNRDAAPDVEDFT